MLDYSCNKQASTVANCFSGPNCNKKLLTDEKITKLLHFVDNIDAHKCAKFGNVLTKFRVFIKLLVEFQMVQHATEKSER